MPTLPADVLRMRSVGAVLVVTLPGSEDEIAEGVAERAGHEESDLGRRLNGVSPCK
jgi:hypothetical protein